MNKKDFKVERFRSGGNGGQNVNKVESAVRITHIPTGLVAQSQNERSQSQNYKEAMRVLNERIRAQGDAERADNLNQIRRAAIGNGRVRTYNLITNTITDYVRDIKMTGARDVLDGRLDLLGGCSCQRDAI